jgi:hypothetical protein
VQIFRAEPGRRAVTRPVVAARVIAKSLRPRGGDGGDSIDDGLAGASGDDVREEGLKVVELHLQVFTVLRVRGVAPAALGEEAAARLSAGPLVISTRPLRLSSIIKI